MVPAIFRKHFRDLLGSRDAEIANQATMQRVGVIKIDHLAHKIGAVSLHKVIALAVGLAVELGDQQRILFRAGLNLESIDCPVIRCSGHLIPVSLGRSAVGAIRSKRFQVIATVLISEESNQLGVGEQRNRLRPVNRIQIGNERDRNPIVSRDPVVPAQDHSGFALGTRTQDYRRHRANAAQIHSRVASSGQRAIVAIRLFKKERRSRMRARNAAEAKQQKDAQSPESPRAYDPRERFDERRHSYLMTRSSMWLPGALRSTTQGTNSLTSLLIAVKFPHRASPKSTACWSRLSVM